MNKKSLIWKRKTITNECVKMISINNKNIKKNNSNKKDKVWLLSNIRDYRLLQEQAIAFESQRNHNYCESSTKIFWVQREVKLANYKSELLLNIDPEDEFLGKWTLWRLISDLSLACLSLSTSSFTFTFSFLLTLVFTFISTFTFLFHLTSFSISSRFACLSSFLSIISFSQYFLIIYLSLLPPLRSPQLPLSTPLSFCFSSHIPFALPFLSTLLLLGLL